MWRGKRRRAALFCHYLLAAGRIDMAFAYPAVICGRAFGLFMRSSPLPPTGILTLDWREGRRFANIAVARVCPVLTPPAWNDVRVPLR